MPPTIEERVAVAKRHLNMAIAWKGERLGIFETRRHYTNYFKGIPNIKPYRLRMVTADTAGEVFAVLDKVAATFSHHQFI